MKNFSLNAKPLSLSAKGTSEERGKNKQLRKQSSSNKHLKYITNIDNVK